MNNKEFIAELARLTGSRVVDTQKMVNTLVGAMAHNFQQSQEDGEEGTVQLPNLGIFEVKKKLERIIVNPSTGQRMLVPPKLTLAFRPTSVLKDKVRKGGEDNG